MGQCVAKHLKSLRLTKGEFTGTSLFIYMNFVIYMVMLMAEKELLLHFDVVATDKTCQINYGTTGVFSVNSISLFLTNLSLTKQQIK